MDGRFSDEHQVFAVFGIGDSGMDHVGSGYAGSHKHVQGVDLVKGVESGVLRGVSDVIDVIQIDQPVVAAG